MAGRLTLFQGEFGAFMALASACQVNTVLRVGLTVSDTGFAGVRSQARPIKLIRAGE